MIERYVTDTNSIISYFSDVFDRPNILSFKAKSLIEQALSNPWGSVRLSIPSIVFVEIYEKWFLNEEFVRKFFYEVYTAIDNSANVEIKPIDKEVIENLQQIGGNLLHHDIHDKLIVASAMMLNCPIITTDSAIMEYVKGNQAIPSVIM
ncbi:MAG: PIN domain-containing protein [Syntrophus sp. (in: bacteria)]